MRTFKISLLAILNYAVFSVIQTNQINVIGDDVTRMSTQPGWRQTQNNCAPVYWPPDRRSWARQWHLPIGISLHLSCTGPQEVVYFLSGYTLILYILEAWSQAILAGEWRDEDSPLLIEADNSRFWTSIIHQQILIKCLVQSRETESGAREALTHHCPIVKKFTG